jgi:hypothetical protein
MTAGEVCFGQSSAPITPGLASVLPPQNYCSNRTGLACAIPDLYGQYGPVLPNATFPARFNSSFATTLSALTTAAATQISLLPVVSPASAFTYEFDTSTGVFTRSTETLGPLMTERAETVGRHRLHFGAAVQRFRFSTLDGYPLHNWPAVFTHQVGTGPNGAAEPYETQFIMTQNSVDLKVNQLTVYGTLGLTDHIDVSVAIPFAQIGLNAASYATIYRTVGTEPALVNGTLQPCCSNGPPYANYFDPANPATSLTNVFQNNQYAPGILNNASARNNLYFDPARHSAAGIGDVTLRFKARVYRGERTTLSFLTDLRLPTGDSSNFLGTGAIGWKPFAALSIRTGPVTPHFNVGYQWNGQSILGGNIIAGTKNNLPGSLFFSAGTDYAISRHVTVAGDYVGYELFNAPQVGVGTYTSQLPLVATGQVGTFPTIVPIPNHAYNQSNASVGAKVTLVDHLVLSGNLWIALNEGGLRQRVVPLIGLSYTR